MAALVFTEKILSTCFHKIRPVLQASLFFACKEVLVILPWVDRDIVIGNRFAQEHETVTKWGVNMDLLTQSLERC